MHKNIFAVAALLSAATFANAEIILSTSQSSVADGVTQYIVSAVGTEGEQINTFSFLNLEGNLHQVASFGAFGPQPTPDADAVAAGGPGNLEANRAFDTYFLLGGSDLVGVVGTRLMEGLPDGSTTDSLPLEEIMLPTGNFRQAAGFSGTLSTPDGAYALTPDAAGDNVAFLQVVMLDDGVATLDVQVDAVGASATFDGYVIGPAIPEPSTALLAGLALVGFVARRK